MVTVRYTPSGDKIPNPERGFYRHYSDCGAAAFDVTQLKNFRTQDGETLVMCVFYLKNFTASTISQSALDFFQKQMDTVRSAGLKTIVRFAYSDNETGKDASPSLVQTHITQLTPDLTKNKDVIALVQSGFVGGWGEWAYSTSFGNSASLTSQNLADRKAVVDKLLQAVPADRTVAVRTPSIKRTFYGSTALSASEAYSGSVRARVAHHNDCFLASASDYGTYNNTSVEYPYLAADTNSVPIGGETCNYTAPRADCPTAISEMSMFHWSYLNLDYNTTVLNAWRNQGCFTQVEQKLGYRFVLQNGSYSSSAKPGGGFTVSFTVANQGWAAPFNKRDVELVLRNTATGALYRFALNTDPRQWAPGKATTVTQTVSLPADMPKGNYAAMLNLPDPESTLRSRPEYAIQLANTNVWDASTGFNNLNHTVNVMQ